LHRHRRTRFDNPLASGYSAPVRNHLFTIDEANALIPRLEIIMGKLQRHGLELREQVSELARDIGQSIENITTVQILELRPHLYPVIEELEGLLGEIESYGGELKGLDLGLVDFPAEIEGERVLLCWQYGEKEVGFYHTVESGFAGRKPLAYGPSRPKLLQ
jgi:hypothetical protein